MIKEPHLPLIIANILPHSKQRYDTCGDWYDISGIRHFIVSKMKKRAYEFAVLIHEMVESEWCNENDVNVKMVDDFDIGYEGKYKDDPGSDPKAPYHEGHKLGLKAERFVIEKVFKLDWKEYEDYLMELE